MSVAFKSAFPELLSSSQKLADVSNMPSEFCPTLPLLVLGIGVSTRISPTIASETYMSLKMTPG